MQIVHQLCIMPRRAKGVIDTIPCVNNRRLPALINNVMSFKIIH